jgi:octaprenyl-diphosphate synthase
MAAKGRSGLGVVVPLDPARGGGASLKPLLDLVSKDMGRLNELILSKAESHVEMIPKLARHLIDSGGKRLRPILTVACSQLCGYAGSDHLPLAAAVEFMHTATLLHDDVVDESDMRRGRTTARILWGNQASVLVGDYLLGQAFKMQVDVGIMDAIAVLANAAAIIAEGEVMQLAAAKNMETTEDEYLAIIRSKTAALFAAASELGAVVCGKGERERAALRSYGNNLGLAFQLVDDALDYAGSAAELGKNVGDDFREGKITLPIILSYRRGTPEEQAFWRKTLTDGEIGDGDLETAAGYMHKHAAIDDTIKRAGHYGAIAKDALAIFPDDTHRKALLEAVDFCIQRRQ